MKDLNIIEDFTPQFNRIYDDFKVVFNNVEDNRATRTLLVDVDSMQAQGKLKPHETYIAIRTVDTNIARAIPAHVAYLTQSRRLAIFRPENCDSAAAPQTSGMLPQAGLQATAPIDPNLQIAQNNMAAQNGAPQPGMQSPPNDGGERMDKTQTLENEFMRVMTYPDWVEAYVRLVDGAELHGFDFVEVSYDEDMPGHVSVEHVGLGNLLFDIRVKCIQQSRLIGRAYEITTVDLYEMVNDYGFDEAVSTELYEKLEEGATASSQSFAESHRIYHCFFKQKGIVSHCWYSKELQKFLKAPEPFTNGVSEQATKTTPMLTQGPNGQQVQVPQLQVTWEPVVETEYPFTCYVHRVTENPRLSDTVGRADLDFYMQEAASTLWSSFVNGCIASSRTMWSPTTPNPEIGVAPKQLTMVVDNGKIWNNPMTPFNSPWPDAMLPKALEMLRTQNSEDTNQISFATNNRRDTRKTATEIEAAQQQDTIMNSVTVTLFGGTVRNILTAAWRIIQSEALQQKITFCPHGGSNDVELIGKSYQIISAGTVDYVQRMELIGSMQTDIPIMAQTAAGPVFLEEYLRLKYPSISEKLILPMRTQQANQQQQLAAMQQKMTAMQTLLKAAVTNPETNQLEPEWADRSMELQSVLN